jgi:TPR repeat protein
MIEKGRGVKFNAEKAARYYGEAVAQGHKEARERLAALWNIDL